MILAQQPTNVQNVADIAYVNTNPPKGSSGVTLWGERYRLVNTKNPFIGSYTGLKPASPKSQYQMATVPLWPCTSAIQAIGNEIGINIQSSSIKKNFAGRGNLGTIVLGSNLQPNIKAFPTNTTKLKYSFDIRIPSMRTYGNVAAQVVSYISFVDTKNKKSFWYGISIFDNRGTNYKDIVMWDVGTKSPIVTGFAGCPTRLLDSTPNPGFFRQEYTQPKHYEFVIGADQMRWAIGLLRSYNPNELFSDNLSDYVVANCNLNPEIHVPDGFFNYAQIGLSVRDWKLEHLVY